MPGRSGIDVVAAAKSTIAFEFFVKFELPTTVIRYTTFWWDYTGNVDGSGDNLWRQYDIKIGRLAQDDQNVLDVSWVDVANLDNVWSALAFGSNKFRDQPVSVWEVQLDVTGIYNVSQGQGGTGTRAFVADQEPFVVRQSAVRGGDILRGPGAAVPGRSIASPIGNQAVTLPAVLGNTLMFRGRIESADLDPKGRMRIALTPAPARSSVQTPAETIEPRCTLDFKDPDTCQYVGADTTCDRTRAACAAHAGGSNLIHFGGADLMPDPTAQIQWGNQLLSMPVSTIDNTQPAYPPGALMPGVRPPVILPQPVAPHGTRIVPGR